MLFSSPVYSQASGSIAGIVYSHNAGGMYTRARATPTNPNSANQQAARTAMANLVSRWSTTLTEAQRAAWNQYAEQVELTGPLGNARTVSGLNHYIRSNVPRAMVANLFGPVAVAIVDDGPTVFSLPELNPLTPVQSDATTTDLEFDDAQAWVDEDGATVIVQIGDPGPQTINFYKGPFTMIAHVEGSSTTPPTTPAAISLPFSITALDALFVRARLSRADGRLSAAQTLRVDTDF